MTEGNPCKQCDDAQNYECDKANNCLFGIKTISVSPVTCEYQKTWRTSHPYQTSTNPDNQIVYTSYSCTLLFCKYPERKCEVKK